MPLMPFTIQEHVPLLLNGRKKQTTRQPRKNPLKVGDVLYCYYKPRGRSGCRNCIALECKANNHSDIGTVFTDEIQFRTQLSALHPCHAWTNYFGEAVITSIVKVRRDENILEYEMANYTKLFGQWTVTELMKWAQADGFDDVHAANLWFGKSSQSWQMLEWDIITFAPEWIKDEDKSFFQTWAEELQGGGKA